MAIFREKNQSMKKILWALEDQDRKKPWLFEHQKCLLPIKIRERQMDKRLN